MEIFKAIMLALALVPLIGATTLKELKTENEQLEKKLAELTETVKALQAQVDANKADFTARMEMKVDVVDSVKLNDTEELEARVTVLEESVSDLEVDVVNVMDDIEDVESANQLQDDRINTLEAEILDNSNDIEVDITNELTTQVTSLEEDVTSLDQRVEDLESGGGGSANVTDLEIRVETLEDLTSRLADDVSSLEDNDVTQDERISSIEEDVTSLDQRVEDLESGGGSENVTDYSDSIFMAALTVSQTSSQDPLIFDWEMINPGGHYSNETGKYTAPYDGIYQFSVHLQAYSTSTGVYFNLEIDDSFVDSHFDGWDGVQLYRATTILLQLAAGQTVHVNMFDGARATTSYLYSYFSGYLISPSN